MIYIYVKTEKVKINIKPVKNNNTLKTALN